MQERLLHHSLTRATDSPAELDRALLPTAAVTFLWTTALLTITTYLVLRRSDDNLARERAQSAVARLRQTQLLTRTRDAVIFALAKLAGFRDHETGGHLERISDYASMLAAALRHHPRYRAQVTPGFVRLIGLSAVLHDIGKVGIEDSVLRKVGPLTAEERRRMQRHTVLAAECLNEIAQRLGKSNFLHLAADIALSHHEHWDGGGYPHGLRGEAIPLAARIVAIADVYDALSMPRVYKPQFPHAECVATIRAGAGRQFDPELVQVWLTLEPKFWAIAERHLRELQAAAPHPHGRGAELQAAEEIAGSSSTDWQYEAHDAGL
jgi:putative two-component system response regulator